MKSKKHAKPEATSPILTDGYDELASYIPRLKELAAGAKPASCAEAALLLAMGKKAADRLQIGDVVRLKSGGHAMTVTETMSGCAPASDDLVTVEWSLRGEIKVDELPFAALERTTIHTAETDDIPF